MDEIDKLEDFFKKFCDVKRIESITGNPLLEVVCKMGKVSYIRVANEGLTSKIAIEGYVNGKYKYESIKLNRPITVSIEERKHVDVVPLHGIIEPFFDDLKFTVRKLWGGGIQLEFIE